VVVWAKRRWREKKDNDLGPYEAHLVKIYGPKGEVLKNILVEGEEAHELSSQEVDEEARKRLP
jgi:hypothetical protein